MKTHTLTNYDHNAISFDRFRRPSPIILEMLVHRFPKKRGHILSLGCGTGRMEKELSQYHLVTGLDLSTGMLGQASERISDLIQGTMTQLPFKSDAFTGAYFMQSLHHIGANLKIQPEERDQARLLAIAEAVRVIKSGPIIIIQRDPSQNQAVWFWTYFPQALKIKLQIQPKVEDLVVMLSESGLQDVQAIPINDSMAIGFYDPRAPLDPQFRQSFSDFSYLSQQELKQGIKKLKSAIRNGSVDNEIEKCKKQFQELGGTVFLISGNKP